MTIQITDQRAQAVLDLAPHVECVAATPTLRIYAVPSRTEQEPRIVRVWPRTGACRCDCPAGIHQKACVHIAAVLLRRKEVHSRAS